MLEWCFNVLVMQPLCILQQSPDASPNFVERESLTPTDVIKLMADYRRVVISGLPGVGKSELALQAVETARSYGTYRGIFWLSASTMASLESGMSEIARALNLLKGADVTNEMIRAAIVNELNNQDSWLMVLDNVDEINYITNILPKKEGTRHVLITSRDQDAYSGLNARNIHLETMTSCEATQLFFKTQRREIQEEDTQWREERDQLSRLVIELDCIPLTVVQAALYLQATQDNIANYIWIYKREKRNALEWVPTQRTPKYFSVGTTLMSFQKIRPFGACVRFLCLISFLHSENIPQSIWRRLDGRFRDDVLRYTFRTESDLTKAVQPLIAYSFIQISARTRSISVHRLVQGVMRDTLEGTLKDSADVLGLLDNEHRSPQYWISRAIEAVVIAYPDIEYNKDWKACEALNIQAAVCIEHCHRYELRTTMFGGLFENLGEYAMGQGQYRNATQLYSKAFRIYEETMGEDGIETIGMIVKIGNAFQRRGVYDNAILSYKIAWKRLGSRFGVNPIRMEPLLIHLASAYQEQGDHNEALTLYHSILDAKEKAWGKYHVALSSTIMNLGHSYHEKGNFEEALKYHKRALEIREVSYGEGSMETVDILHNLGFAYHALGKYDEAIQQYECALQVYAAHLGPDHLESAETLVNLGYTYSMLERYDAALEKFQNALRIVEREFGSDHIFTAPKIVAIGCLYMDQDMFEEAIMMYERALKIYEAEFEKGNIKTIDTLLKIGTAYSNQKKFDEACSRFEEVLTITEKTYGPNHTTTGDAIGNLGTVYCNQKDYSKAREYFTRALAIFENASDKNATKIATTIMNIANVHRILGQHEEAIREYERVVKILNQNIQGNHNEIILLERNIGGAYHDKGNYDAAIAHYTRALEVTEEVFGKEHIKLAEILQTIGANFRKQQKMTLAIPRYTRAIQILEHAYGDNHIDTVMARLALSDAYACLGMTTEAISELNRIRKSSACPQIEGLTDPQGSLPASSYYDRGRRLLLLFFSVEDKDYLHEALVTLQLGAANVPAHDSLRESILDTLSITSEIVEVMSRAVPYQHPNTVNSIEDIQVEFPGLGLVKLSELSDFEKPHEEWLFAKLYKLRDELSIEYNCKFYNI